MAAPTYDTGTGTGQDLTNANSGVDLTALTDQIHGSIDAVQSENQATLDALQKQNLNAFTSLADSFNKKLDATNAAIAQINAGRQNDLQRDIVPANAAGQGVTGYVSGAMDGQRSSGGGGGGGWTGNTNSVATVLYNSGGQAKVTVSNVLTGAGNKTATVTGSTKQVASILSGSSVNTGGNYSISFK